MEQDSFESLYRDNVRKLTAYASARLNDPNLAEEVVQDVFYTALKQPEKLWRHGAPEACLMQILKNKIRECRRSRQRYLRLFVSMESEPGAASAGGSEPSSPAGLMESVRSALSPEEWYILRRFVFEGAGHLELAKELGISVWASQKRLERIRKKLLEILPDP